MRVFLAYVFLVGLLLLFAAAGYGLWACADAAAHAAWYCRLLESIKPFTELISVILAFFGFLFGTIFSKNLAQEKDTRALARAFAAEVQAIRFIMEARITNLQRDDAPKSDLVLIHDIVVLSMSELPVYNRTAQSLGRLPETLAEETFEFYWLVVGAESRTRDREVDRDRFYDAALAPHVVLASKYGFFPEDRETWEKLAELASELHDKLLVVAQRPMPPWWNLMWLR